MSELFNVKLRDKKGTANSRRLRRSQLIPAVLYGRGQANVCLAIAAHDVESAIRHGSKVVELAGDVSESALIKEVQFDALGTEIKHLDLERIDVTANIEVTLHVELHGVSPGATSGGILKMMIHELEISCPATKVPDKLEVNINHLEIGQSVHAGEVPLPEGAELLSSPDEVVVQCTEAVEVEEVEEGAEAAGEEPEVIGRKAEEEESED